MFELPENWTSFIVRDPAGNTWKSGSGSRLADLSGIPKGRYSLTSPDGTGRYHLIISGDIPGGVLAVHANNTGAIDFRFGNTGSAGTYYVSLQTLGGVLQQSFYVYSPESTLAIPAGQWRVTVAEPGQSGFSFLVDVNSTGQLEKLNRIGLSDKADWFVESASFPVVESLFTYNTGSAVFDFSDNINSQRFVQIRNKQTGIVTNHFTDKNRFETTLDPGKYEWRVLGIAQESIAYPGLFDGLNSIAGGWISFTQRSANERPPVSLPNPSGWTSYVVKDPFGNLAGSATGENWIDFSELAPGRYSLVGNTSSGPLARHEVVVSPEIEGGVATIHNVEGGGLEIRFGDPSSSDPFYVAVKSADGRDISGSYYYGTNIGLNLPNGDYSVSISRPGQAGFSVNLGVASGKLSSVNNVRTVDSPDWYLASVDLADPFGPITSNSGQAHFSFDAAKGDFFVIQLRDPYTQNVGTYFSETEALSVTIDGGYFEWRAFGVPGQARNDPQLVARITAAAGGWTRFYQHAQPPLVDYILGQERDQIQNADQLTLNYPTDAIKLADGSIVVSNTYSATVERIFADGSIQRLAGGNSEGYVETGIGPDVLLRGPTQLFDSGDGAILVVDSRNFVVREININSGTVQNKWGNNSILEPTIVNGQLVGLGDIYDIGRDNQGNFYITAAKTTVVGDQLYSDETQVLRQDSSGNWSFWAFDTSILTRNSFKFVDMLFHNGIISVVAHDGTTKRYLQYNQDGSLRANIEIGIAFGGGLIQDPQSGDLIIGNHSAIMRLNYQTLAISTLPFSEPLANVSFMHLRGSQLVVTDSDRGRVFEYDLATGKIVKSYGQSSSISNVVIDLEAAEGSLLMLDNQTPRVLSYTDGKINVLAGSGIQSAAQPGVNAQKASFSFPGALARGGDGTLYVADANHRITKIGADQTVQAFAGSLEAGFSGDGGPATNAKFRTIYGLDVGPDGSVFVADAFNHAIRKITPDGNVTTIVGNGHAGLASYAGTNLAALNTPNRVLVTTTGRVFISDSWNNRIIEYMPDGRLLPFAGVDNFTIYQGSGDFFGDGGSAVTAGLNTPIGIAFYEADGTMFIADSFNNRIRYVDSAGNIHTLIGADRGYSFGTLLNLPNDVALVGDDLFIADTGNALVLKLTGVDRTGNDLSNSLDIGKAVERAGINSRSEYVSSDDLDFYNLTAFANGSVTITASQDNLTIDFSDGSHSYYGRQVLEKGQSYTISSQQYSYFVVSSSVKQKYEMLFSQTSMQAKSSMFAEQSEVAQTPTDSLTRSTALMIQSMASFGAVSGGVSLREQSSMPSYDFFA